jgi:hypothetical protein
LRVATKLPSLRNMDRARRGGGGAPVGEILTSHTPVKSFSLGSAKRRAGMTSVTVTKAANARFMILEFQA